MKKLLFLIFGILIVTFIQGFSVNAQGANVELVIDPECSKYLATRSPNDPIVCSSLCNKACVDQGLNCLESDQVNCHNLSFEIMYDDIPGRYREAFNIFGLELCPDPETIDRPVDDPYCTVILVRLGFYAIISLIIFATVVMGLWGVWERSTAADNPEKIEKSVKIFRNAIVGVILSLSFIGIIQLVSLLLGLTGSLFDISIVPQPRVVPRGGNCGGYTVCADPQDSCVLDPVAGFKKCM